MPITIYDKAGNPKVELSPNDSSTQVTEIQGDSVLTLSFSHYEHIDLDVDDYADFEGERYWLTEKYRPKQKSTKEWSYDIKLYGVESMIKRLLVIKTVDNEEEPVFTLTAPAREHVAMIVKCMNAGMGNITDWKVGQVDGAENIVIDYFGKYCDQALKEIAEKAGAEWWVEGQTVNICRCEHGEPVSMGYDKGLTGIEPGTADNVKFYTRLYPVGSSRNIDREKYGSTRLRLPGGQKYVEMNADKYGRVDHYEADAFADIYPRRVGVVSSVRSEVRTGEDGKPFTIYYFRDDSLPFDPNDYEIGGLVKRVSFQEGSELAGLGDEEDGTNYFEVNYNSDTREFEIITIWPYDDDTQLPGGTLVPKEGDKYILWNLRMPDEYYTLAEEEFLAAVNKYNADHNLDLTVYKASTDHVWIEDNNVGLTIGRRVRLESEEYFPGTGYRDSRITRISRKVNLPSQMDLEIGDALSRTAMSTMSDSIESVRSYARTMAESISLPDIIRTGDMTRATDNNLLSALRSYRDLVRKDRDDRSPHKIASDQGFEAGNYLAGVSGGMLGIDNTDGQSFAEVYRLFVRGKAYFETLIIVEAETLGGKRYLTPGDSIKCVKVEEIKNNAGTVTAYRCWFLSEQDGEKTECKFIVNDQAISETFNTDKGTYTQISNSRYWRLVTAVNNSADSDDGGNSYGYIDLSATDCEADSSAPLEGDVIAQLGYRGSDRPERQAAMIFDTVGPQSPSIVLLTGIGSGTTNAEHYTLKDRDIISEGYDHTTGKAYFRVGSQTAGQYLDYKQDQGLTIAGKLTVNSTIGNQTFEQWLLGHGYTDDSALDAFKQSYNSTIADIKTQIDGKAETWYQAIDPSTVDRQNGGWLGESDAMHKGDLWYCTADIAGTSYKKGTTWYWNGTAWEKQDVPDSVFDAIDGKADIFVSKPSSYHKNDLWFLESDYVLAGNKWYDAGTLVVATQDSTVWNSAHWTKKDRYTDDTLAQTAIDSIADYEYLKVAIVDGASQAIGGLFLSSYIKLGTWNKSNPDKPVFDTPWSGLNGVYVNGRTPSYFAGGDMIDRFDAQDNMLNVAGRRYATSMVRMDGSAYFLDGKVQFKSNGTAQFGLDSSAVTIDGAGHLALGNGISINIGGEAKGLGDSIASVTNLANKLANLFIPYVGNSAKTWGDITDISTVTSVKVRTGIWTESFISARGLNSNGGSGTGGGGKSYLSDLLDVQLGTLTSGQFLRWNGTKWVNSAFTTPDMSGYALESWVEANYVTLGTAQTISGQKTFMTDVVIASERSFVTCQPRNAAGSGGWAHNHFQVNDSQGNPFLNIGAYGNAAQLEWIYIGSGGYNSNSNLRISPTGFATAARFIRYGGTSSQVLMADGSVQTHWKAASITTATSDEGMITPLGMNNWVSANFYKKTDSDSRFVKKAGDTMTGVLNINTNSRTLILGCQNPDWAHYSVDASQGHYFNKKVAVNGEIYAGSSYNKRVFHQGFMGSGSGLDADLLDGVHVSELARGGAAYYEASDGTGARWIRIATFSHYTASGIITIVNTWHHNANSALIFSFCVGYRGNDRYTLTQIGGTNALFSRARIVYPTATNEAGFIEVYYDEGVAGHNFLYVRLTNAINATLIQTATSGAVPSTHAAYEQEFTACGMAARNIKASTFYGSLSGNALSATKLQTARTLWGQSFNGTGNVSGNLTGVGDITMNGNLYGVKFLTFLPSVNTSAAAHNVAVQIDGNSLNLSRRTLSNVFEDYILSVNLANSYVGLGTTTPQSRLEVAGTIKSTGNPGFMCETASNVWSYLRLKSGTVMYDIALYGDYLSGALQIRPKGAEANKVIITQGGDVGINLTGTNLPICKLEVNGTTRINYLLTALAGVQIGDTYDYGWYLNSARLAAGQGTARGVNVGSLLVSNAWADATKVPANGIYSKGAVRIGDCTISWDSVHGMLKFDKGLYSEGAVSARGINANAGGGTGGGATSLSGLTDVQLGTLTSGQFLKWNGTKWTNATIAMPSLTGYALESWVNANFLPYTALDDDGELGGTFLKTDGSNATSSTLSGLTSWLPAFPMTAIADTDMFYIKGSRSIMCGALSIWGYIKSKMSDGGDDTHLGTSANPFGAIYVKGISTDGSATKLNICCAGSVNQLNLYSNGTVGLGTSAQSTYRFDVNGTGRFTGSLSCQKLTQTSDMRMKTVTDDLALTLRSLADAPVFRFFWRNSGESDFGTSAQYWQSVDPALVVVSPEGALGIDYGKIALAGLKTVARMTLDHEERIAELERENGDLRQQIAELQTK